MGLVGSGSEKAKHHRNPSPKCPNTKNDPFASLPQAAERAPLKSCKTKSMAAVGGQKPYRNLAWTKTKLDLVGSGCEKAKHHLNPSPKRPKTRRNRRKDMSQNKLGRQKTKTKMGLVGSGCEKDKHHLNPSPKRPKTRGNRRKDMSQNKLGRQKKQRALLWGPLKTTK